MLKRLWGILLCCLMVLGTSLAASYADEYIPIASLDDFHGIWTSYGSNDSCPYLVLHADGTFEAYAFWQLDEDTVNCDRLLKHGTYTFHPADSTFRLEGDDTVYLAQTAPAGEGYENSIGEIEVAPGTPVLLLEATRAPEQDAFGDRSMLFLPMAAAEMALLPTREELSQQNRHWVESILLQDTGGTGLPCWHFDEDGSFTISDPARVGQDVSGTYAYDHGLLIMTDMDQNERHLLFQYVNIPFPSWEEGDPAEPFYNILHFFDYDSEEDYNASTILSNRLLVVHDIDEGTLFYMLDVDGCSASADQTNGNG